MASRKRRSASSTRPSRAVDRVDATRSSLGVSLRRGFRRLSRDAAWRLLTEYTKSESLLKHALAVEAAVRGYARKFGEPEVEWGIVAPAARLRLRAVADARGSSVPRLRDSRSAGLSGMGPAGHPLARRLQRRAARKPARKNLVRLRRDGRIRDGGHARAAEQERARSRSELGHQADEGQGVRARVKREDLRAGAELLGLPLDEHISNVIASMREEADALGLRTMADAAAGLRDWQ